MSTRPHSERRPANLSAFAQLRLNVYMTVFNVVFSPVLYVWNIVASKRAHHAIHGALWLSTMGFLFSIAVVLRSIELGNSALLTWVNRLLGIDHPLPKEEEGGDNAARYLGAARPLVESPEPQPQQLSPTKPADPVVQAPPPAVASPPPDSHARADTRMTYPYITQTSNYESDDGEHSQWPVDSPVRPIQEIEHAAELEDPRISHSERKGSLSLTFNHLRELDGVDDNSSAQQQRSYSTVVTVNSETPAESPTEPIVGPLHESPIDVHEGIPAIEEPVVQPDEPTVVAQVEQRPPPSPEALPPPYASPPDTPPTNLKEQYAFHSLAALQNGVTEVAGSSSSESGANEEPAPAQPEPVPDPDTLTVPSSSDTAELVSPVESEVFVYPTTDALESPEDDVFHYPAAEPVEPTPAEPIEPVAPTPHRAFRERHVDLEDTPPSDPAPAYRSHSPHFGMASPSVRSQRYSLTQDMLPAPEVFSPPPVPAPIRASALVSARPASRDSFTPSRIDSSDYNRYSPRPRQTSSPAVPPLSGSVPAEDINDASSDLGDASATGAQGDARRKRRKKRNNKTSRRSVVFSDEEPEVIGSASDWAIESGEESSSASPAAVNQFDRPFSRQMSHPPVSSPLARSAMPAMRESDFPPSGANSDKIEVLSPTSSVDSRGPLPSYRSPGSSRAASPAPSIGSVGSTTADGDWSARKVDAYGRWYQAMNKHQPVPQIPRLKQEMTACDPDELGKRLKLGAAALPTKHTPILLGAQHGAGRGRFKARR